MKIGQVPGVPQNLGGQRLVFFSSEELTENE